MNYTLTITEKDRALLCDALEMMASIKQQLADNMDYHHRPDEVRAWQVEVRNEIAELWALRERVDNVEPKINARGYERENTLS